MLSRSRFLIVCAVLALLLVFSLAFLEWAATWYGPHIQAAYLLKDGGRRAITLPFSELSPVDSAVYEYLVELDWRTGGPTRFRLIPDDYLESITVNGQRMPEFLHSGSGRGDWNNGLIVDFGSYLRNGENELVFRVADHGGAYGMNLRGSGVWSNPVRITALVLNILFTLALVFVVLRRFKMDNVLIVLVLLALAWQLVSLAARDHGSYAYDLREGGRGHVNYIQYVAEKGALPVPHGWSFYHPPLYYILGAGVYLLAQSLRLADPFKVLQFLSLVLYWVFLAYSMRLLAQIIRQVWLYRVAVALLFLWPVGSLCALRIGNDALLYPLFMMALFYGHKWFVGEKLRDLLLASICCGLGFFAKISILPCACVLGVLVLWRLYRRRTVFPLRHAVAAIAILAGGFFLSAVDNWAYEIKAKHPKWYMAPFASLGSSAQGSLFVKDRVVNYIIPDTKAWFESKYISSRDDATGRANFWNYMGKTAMYGEWSFHSAIKEKYMAPFMNVSFAFLFVIACYGLPMFWRRRRIPYTVSSEEESPGYSRREVRAANGKNVRRGHIRRIGRCLGALRADLRWGDFRFVLAVTVSLVLLCVLARLNSSMPALSDFRYILPIMPVLVAAVASGLTRLRYGGLVPSGPRMARGCHVRRWCFVFANVIAVGFALVSLIFFFGM